MLASLPLPFGSSQPSHEFQRRQEISQVPLSVITPLGSTRRWGLIASICVASVSFVATFSLLCFLTYRMIFWKKYHRRYIGYNHYIVLVYNLALADAQQCLAFLISSRWIATDSIDASDGFCFLQGIWLQIGDPMSGLFVLAIAVYTSLHIILNYQMGHRLFVSIVVALWAFGVLMVIIPIAAVGRWVWLPAVAWVSSSLPHYPPASSHPCLTLSFTTPIVLVNFRA